VRSTAGAGCVARRGQPRRGSAVWEAASWIQASRHWPRRSSPSRVGWPRQLVSGAGCFVGWPRQLVVAAPQA
jgi:hypothetical protein